MSQGSLAIENARIWTGDSDRPWATTLRSEGGRITAIDGERDKSTEVIDARGCVVVPGLIDAHMHLLMGGESLADLDLSCVTSRAEFERAIAARSRALPPEAWLVARGWQSENFTTRQLPDKSWLTAAGDRPVVCHRMDLHAALVNDAVLALCRRHHDLGSDPPGGRIVRDARTGEPTGLMVEAAAWTMVNPLIPGPTIDQRQNALRLAMRHANSFGLTTVGSMEYRRQVEEVFMPLRDGLTVRCCVTLLDRDWPMDFTFGTTFPSHDRLAVIGYKAFADGTLGSRTARMLQAYSDDAGNRGLLVELAERGVLREWAEAVASRGLSPSIHAIGDEAARLALDAIEHLDPAVRPRLEHVQQLAASDIARFRGGRIASMQPLHKADDGRYVERRVGRERLNGTFAFRSLLDAGATLAFGSDWPVVSCDPVAGMRAAITGVTRDGAILLPEQNLTVEQALAAYTRGAAYGLRLDHAGVLRPGALGDMVIFDRDPFEAEWVADPPRVVTTIVGGIVMYDGRLA
jgi:predicted amidohydrolase YtcJ